MLFFFFQKKNWNMKKLCTIVIIIKLNNKKANFRKIPTKMPPHNLLTYYCLKHSFVTKIQQGQYAKTERILPLNNFMKSQLLEKQFLCIFVSFKSKWFIFLIFSIRAGLRFSRNRWAELLSDRFTPLSNLNRLPSVFKNSSRLMAWCSVRPKNNSESRPRLALASSSLSRV
jgi:hypothetical protein